jgi:hypothetical protein
MDLSCCSAHLIDPSARRSAARQLVRYINAALAKGVTRYPLADSLQPKDGISTSSPPPCHHVLITPP